MKKTYSYFILLVQGFVFGFFEMIPFFRIDYFKNLVHHDKTSYDTFDKNFKKNWTYYLGASLGIIFFYAAPINYLKDNYLPTFAYVFLAVISVNLLFSCIEYFLKKITLIDSIMNAAIILISILSLFFINFENIYVFKNYGSYIILSLIIVLFTFLSLFSNLTLSSFLILGGIFFTVSDDLQRFALLQNIKDVSLLVIFIFLGLFVGWALYVLFNYKVKIKNKNITTVAVLLFALIMNIKYVINKSPISDVSDSIIATKILFLTSLIAFIAISLLLAIYSLYNILKNERRLSLLTGGLNIEKEICD